MTFSPLAKTPIIRLLVPFIVGILCHECFPCAPAIAIGVGVMGILLAFALPLLSRSPLQRLKFRPYTSIPVFLISLSIGWGCSIAKAPKLLNLQDMNGKIAYGRIEDINFKEFSSEMTVLLKSENAKGAVVRITTRGCNYNLSVGNLISFKANFSKIVNANCKEDIDFAQILKRKGIIYQQHEVAKAIIKYGDEPSVTSRLSKIRTQIQSFILNSDMNDATKSFVISLVLGDKKFIDANTRYEYSCAGVAHILALSGLHIGTLALLIWWIMKPLDYCNMRKTRLIITIVVIFGYDLLTGMSPSVVRASIMISFTFFAYILFRRTTPLNALLSAALLILMVNPQALFNAGFQLSFITVGTLLITDSLLKTKRAKTKWQQFSRYFITMCITSAMAMLATIAISAYYFHTTSWVSIFSNLLILPIFPVFMVIAIFIVILAALQLNMPILNSAAEILVSYFNSVVNHITRLPLSHTDNIYVTGWEVGIYYLFFIFFILALINRKWLYGIISTGFLAFGIACHAITGAMVCHEGIAMFNTFTHSPVFYYNGNIGYIWTPDDAMPIKEEDFRRQHKGFLARYNIDSLVTVSPTDTIKTANCLYKPPFAYINGKLLMIAGKNKWKYLERNKDVTLNYCIIGRHFHGTISDLKRLFNINLFVLSGNLYEPNEKELVHQLDSLQLPYASLRTGPIIVPLQ